MSKHSLQPAPSQYLHRDLSTQNQLSMLLSVAQCAMNFLTVEEPDLESGETPKETQDLSGETRLAAETTFIKAMAKIDSILDDKNRWGLDYQLALERQYCEDHYERMQTFREQQIALKLEQKKALAQKMAAEEVSSPHFRYKPVLVQDEDNGQWAAILGDLNDLDHSIIGVGASPAAALRAFDTVFSGGVPEKYRQLVEQREKELNDSKHETLDGSGVSGIDGPDSQRENNRPDGGTSKA